MPDILPFRPLSTGAMQVTAPQVLGLLAGAGRFPLIFAEAARAQGHTVVGVGVRHMCPPELAGVCDQFRLVRLGQLGAAIRFFQRHGVTSGIMAGKIEKRALFHPLRIFSVWPDWRAWRLWFRRTAQDKKDDTLLMAVIREFEEERIPFGSALEFCPSLLVQHGFLTRRKPTPAQWADIRFGWELAREMGRLDVGQSVVVKSLATIAIEAIEGTDQCIRRAGELCRMGGFTVVKVAKPQQDMRFDVPTIGPTTIQSMINSGGKVLAIESEKTIVIDQPEVLRLADRHGLTIVAVNAAELALRKAG